MLILQALSEPDGLQRLVALLIALVLGISVHEFAHAAAATWLGDSLPRRQGRLTLAPAAHLDVIGSLMFLIGGFGWGRPVQYNPYALRAGLRSGPALVAFAGPLSNVILAALIAIPLRLLVLLTRGGPTLLAGQSPTVMSTLITLLASIVLYNLVLAVFNLIPIFPLDGFSILLGVLPAEMANVLDQTRPYGFFLLIALLLLDRYVDVLGMVMAGPISLLLYLLVYAGF